MMYVYRISSEICQWQHFVNRSTFSEVMIKSQVYCFFDSHCRWNGNIDSTLLLTPLVAV